MLLILVNDHRLFMGLNIIKCISNTQTKRSNKINAKLVKQNSKCFSFYKQTLHSGAS